MLMISRRVGESICIGDDVEVVIKEIHRRHVKLAVKAGPRQLILRGELRASIEAANRAAATTSIDFELPAPNPTAAASAAPPVPPSPSEAP
jgi:carbon storage regulator